MDSAYRSQITIFPWFNHCCICLQCKIRSAMKVNEVMNGSDCFLIHSWTYFPIVESVGSNVQMVSWPADCSFSATNFDMVDLPDPSIPSNVTNCFMISFSPVSICYYSNLRDAVFFCIARPFYRQGISRRSAFFHNRDICILLMMMYR